MTQNSSGGQNNSGGQTGDSEGKPLVEIPGDTNASDIVSRTGEEMPEVAHDSTDPDQELGHSGNPQDEQPG
jgi:hypothetical protein